MEVIVLLAFVFEPIGKVGGRVVAYSTIERFFVRVDPIVLDESLPNGKTFAAYIAYVRQLTVFGVHAENVQAQGRLFLKHFAAMFATPRVAMHSSFVSMSEQFVFKHFI